MTKRTHEASRSCQRGKEEARKNFSILSQRISRQTRVNIHADTLYIRVKHSGALLRKQYASLKKKKLLKNIFKLLILLE